MLNALLHVIVEEKLYDEQYIQANVTGFEALKAKVKDFSPEAMAEVCGIEASVLREVARTYAKSERSIIFWGMGISQHTHGTDNSRCLIALALITGHVGRPGTGLHPLRGQNNVQGASDAGLIPMYFPITSRSRISTSAAQYENFWGQTLDPKRGLTVVEIIDAIHADEIKGMYIMGENPAMSDPDQIHARARSRHARPSGGAGHLPHRDGMARRCGAAGLGARREARHLYQHQPAGADRPAGRWICRAKRARTSELIVDLARRMGLDWNYNHVADVYAEMASVMPSLEAHLLGAHRTRGIGHLSGGRPGQARQRDRLLVRLSDLRRTRPHRAGRSSAARRSAGRGVSAGADHRPSA